MIFLYSAHAGEEEILLSAGDENFLYLTKVKRSAVGDILEVSNLEDGKKYTYVFSEIKKREMKLTLSNQSPISTGSMSDTSLHLVWGICDPKTIQKTLPFLNEIGISKITFLECERTQGNFVTQLKKNSEEGGKIQKILEQSCQQSGRNSRMKIDSAHFTEFFDSHLEADERSNFCICDFPAPQKFENFLENKSEKITLLVGPEGGFSDAEKKYFLEKFPENIFQFSSHVLRSETAVIGASGRFLL